MTHSYANPRAFKDALEARIKRRATEQGVAMNRLRQVVLFERFLARVYAACGEAVILKGGFGLELRLERARTTRDIDLRVVGELDELIARIDGAAREQGSDYLSFAFAGERDFQEMLGDQVVYDGRRLQVRAKLAGKPYGDPFLLDLSVADRLVLPPDNVVGTDLLEFADIGPVLHSVYPEEAHVAEKLHAYSMPREDRTNSRTKDLVDIGLLAKHAVFEADMLRRSVEATFTFRDTHPVPICLDDPPPDWTHRYEQIRARDDLEWVDVDTLFALCRAFLDPILGNERSGATWARDQERWR